MHGVWPRPATSSTTTTLSTIPTGARSPETVLHEGVCFLVKTDGDVDYNARVTADFGSFYGNTYAYYSYGSPDNDWIARDDYVLYVDLDGSLGDVYDVERSYGYKLDSISGHKLEKLFA